MSGSGSAAKFPVLFVNLARTWGGGQQWHLAIWCIAVATMVGDNLI